VRIKKIVYSGKEFICNSCNYLWISKKQIGQPGKCPKCNSVEIRHLTKEQFASYTDQNIDRYGNLY
jgi:rubrerythrin